MQMKTASARHIAFLGVAVLATAFVARAQQTGDSAPVTPWVSAESIFLAPTTAEIAGDGFTPGAALWLDVIDPLGGVVTTPVVADGAGRILVTVAVDQPGIYVTRIRDGNGQLLAEGELFVGTD